MVGKQSKLDKIIPSSAPHPTPSHTDRVSPAILFMTSSMAASLPLLRLIGYTHVAAPAAISVDLPLAYQGFVGSTMFAFSCAFSAMFLYRKPQVARLCRLSAIICFSSASLLFFYAVFCNRLIH